MNANLLTPAVAERMGPPVEPDITGEAVRTPQSFLSEDATRMIGAAASGLGVMATGIEHIAHPVMPKWARKAGAVMLTAATFLAGEAPALGATAPTKFKSEQACASAMTKKANAPKKIRLSFGKMVHESVVPSKLKNCAIGEHVTAHGIAVFIIPGTKRTQTVDITEHEIIDQDVGVSKLGRTVTRAQPSLVTNLHEAAYVQAVVDITPIGADGKKLAAKRIFHGPRQKPPTRG